MAIGGKQKTELESVKKVGVFVGKPICVNPSREEYKEKLGIDLSDESKADEYLSTSADGNTTLRVNIWVEDKSGFKQPVTFFLEDKEKTNTLTEEEEATGSKTRKYQYINNKGITTWVDKEENLKSWFTKGGPDSYRKAHPGEEELHNFCKIWSNIDFFKDPEAELLLEWKPLMKGNVNELKSLIGDNKVVCMAEVKSVEKDGNFKEYQAVYNRSFLPAYRLANFNLIDYNKPEIQEALRKKDYWKDLKDFERFVVDISGQYGSKNSYSFSTLKDYNPNDFLVASNAAISEEGADY